MPSSAGRSAKLRRVVERHEESSRTLGQHDVGARAQRRVRGNDARGVDGDPGFRGREVRGDRGFEQVGIDHGVGVPDARLRLQQQRVLVGRAFRSRDAARGDRLHAGDRAPDSRSRRSRAAVTSVLPTPVSVPVTKKLRAISLCSVASLRSR